MYEFVIYSNTFKLSGLCVSDYLTDLLESSKWKYESEVSLGWQLYEDDSETHYIMLTAFNDIVDHFISDLKLPISISTGPEIDEPLTQFEEWNPSSNHEEAMRLGYIHTPKRYCDACTNFITNHLGGWRCRPPVI